MGFPRSLSFIALVFMVFMYVFSAITVHVLVVDDNYELYVLLYTISYWIVRILGIGVGIILTVLGALAVVLIAIEKVEIENSRFFTEMLVLGILYIWFNALILPVQYSIVINMVYTPRSTISNIALLKLVVIYATGIALTLRLQSIELVYPCKESG